MRAALRAVAALLVASTLAACGGALPGMALDGPPAPGIALATTRCESEHGSVHAVRSGSGNRIAVLFLHGTPGRWRAFERYLSDPDLISRAQLVAADRLGWGASRLRAAPDAVAPDFGTHSAAFAPLLEALSAANGGAGTIIVGHSLGASLAPRLAADHGADVRGLLLLSGSHDPQLRARRWYNLLADLPPVRWLLADDLRRSNDEIMALPAQLRANAERWPRIEAPVTVIQGLEDPLVSPGHADFLEALAPRARILRLEDTNHFVPWNRYGLVKRELLALIDLVESEPPRERTAAIPTAGACSPGSAPS